jgi:uncharacterized protein (DUF885 family)
VPFAPVRDDVGMSVEPVRALADELADRLLSANPFYATMLGIRDYDALVPDNSEAAEEALAADLADLESRASTLAPPDPAGRTTLGVIVATCASTRRELGMRPEEHTVSPQPQYGPPALLALTAITSLPDSRAAVDYLTRLRSSPPYLDNATERLHAGAARGRLPVRSLVDLAIDWCDHTLATPVPPALVPAPPAGWDGASAWREQVADVAANEIVPAIARWRAELVELRSRARPDDAAGLSALPGGEQDYLDAIAVHTTLPLTADELHRTGRDAIAALNERARELGAQLGMSDLGEILAAIRRSSADQDPQQALASARAAVARAEARAHEIMPEPLPGPCSVEAMPATVAESGMAPHYSPPRRDGSRPGTYWFNTLRPSAGAGWDLESVAFHETVPGHHSQLARQQMTDLPLVQQLLVTVHAEGWGLYAERLADEFGLYSDVRAQLGAVATELFRAARLVVDTGLHAFGWTRQQAVDFMVERVPLPEGYLADEVIRYIAWPGQALAYLTGQREILRLRANAQQRLGNRFDLPGFNAALLDSGSLPMPVLATVVDDWVRSTE